ncbi:ABC transporter ATP-binding protein/permease [Sphingopyxis sp.]|uniref:ABC transporter ATP-binding protein/permease n=1 Tax=Sphingopyxis sp. TaxID=1908224 RepID=UPI00261D5C56|nr:ATP-binding cassette domain-containing protein [Sphingopyxis sp.]MCW0199450.1 ATP-binding cassette domain-containing protein [Sphingopyxis sp.]
MTDAVSPEDAQVVKTDRPPEFRSDRFWNDLKYIGGLLGRYLRADPVMATIFVALKVGVGIVGGYISVEIAAKSADLTDALIARQAAAIWGIVTWLLILYVLNIVQNMINALSGLILRIRWRNFFTLLFLGKWLSNNSFYHLEAEGRVDHPEQRIQEDGYNFPQEIVDNILPSLTYMVTYIILFTAKVWEMSPSLPLTGIGLDVTIPSYLFFVTILFAIFFNVTIHKTGNRLTRAELVRQRVEAGFRHDLARVRENSEAIAFENGGRRELGRMTGSYGLIRENWRHYTIARLLVGLVTIIPAFWSSVFPILFVVPLVAAGKMTVGEMQFFVAAQLGLQTGLTSLFSGYQDIARVRSAGNRIQLLETELSEPRASQIHLVDGGQELVIADLRIHYPDGHLMTDIGSLSVRRGDRILVQGASGAGKSTMLRAMAGLWPHGSGTIALPRSARMAFLPQRSYMPEGTLAALLSYPADAAAYDDGSYRAVLKRLSLDRLLNMLDTHMAWGKVLSPGEQQRIAAARVLLMRPDFLFLDEATSALDAHLETELYRALAAAMPGAAWISVAHRPAIAEFHDQVVRLADGQAFRSPLLAND